MKLFFIWSFRKSTYWKLFLINFNDVKAEEDTFLFYFSKSVVETYMYFIGSFERAIYHTLLFEHAGKSVRLCDLFAQWELKNQAETNLI